METKELDLKKLGDDMETCISEMDALTSKIGTLEKEDGKDQEVTDAKTLFEEMETKFKGLESEVIRAKDQQRRYNLLKDVRALAQPLDITNASYQVPAEAKDWMADIRAHEEGFYLFCANKEDEIQSKVRDMLEPVSKNLAGKGALVPPRYCNMMLGPRPGMLGAKADEGPPILSTHTSAGNLFDREFRPDLLSLQPEPGHFFQLVRKVPTNTGNVLWPRVVRTDGDEHSGVDVTWISEGALKPYEEPLFDQLNITTNELAARTEISNTMLRRSAINLEGFMNNEFRASIMSELDNVILDGSGTGRPLGILQDADVRVVNREVGSQIEFNDLVDLEHAIRAHHRAGGQWAIADGSLAFLKKIKDNDGRPIFSAGVNTAAFDTILGYPFIPHHRLDAFVEGDIIFGNWSQYMMAVETEIVMARSEHNKIQNNVTVFVVFMHIGGRAAQPRAFVRTGNDNNS